MSWSHDSTNHLFIHTKELLVSPSNFYDFFWFCIESLKVYLIKAYFICFFFLNIYPMLCSDLLSFKLRKLNLPSLFLYIYTSLIEENTDTYKFTYIYIYIYIYISSLLLSRRTKKNLLLSYTR